MARIDFTPDRRGLEDLLKHELAGEIHKLAEQVAENVKAQGLTVNGDELPLVVDKYTTDRAAASITIKHPAGLPMEAKYGVLTKAAAAAGLEVKAK